MAEIGTTKLYDIEVRATDSLKTLAELRLRSAQLRDEQKELGKVTEENAERYYELDSQIKAVNKEASTYQKRVTDSIKFQNQMEASLGRLRTQLSLDTAEYVKLGNTQADLARKDVLGKQIATTTEEIKRQEEALGDHRRSVGDYGKGLKDLKTELREVTDQIVAMASAGNKNSEEYQTLIQRAGELKKAQQDVRREIDASIKSASTIKTLTESVTGITAAYGLWTSASAILGSENEELEASMKKMMTVITALNSLQAINATLSKTSTTYRAAYNLVQKIGINQTARETKALAAKNAMMTSGTVGTKVATAATWLWNAALAANPVVLVTLAVAGLVAGIAALSGAFKSNTEESKAAAKAMREYEDAVRQMNAGIEGIEKRAREQREANELASQKEMNALKARGATSQEIAEAQLRATTRLYQIEVAAAKARSIENKEALEATIAAIAAKEKELKTWDKSIKKLKEAQTELSELYDTAKELQNALDIDAHAAEKAAEDMVTARVDAAREASDKAYEIAVNASTMRQNLLSAEQSANNVFISSTIKTRLDNEKKLFDIQQNGQKERLELQRRFGKITQGEYEKQLEPLEVSTSEFASRQANELNNHFKSLKDRVLSLAKESAEEQIAEVITDYEEAMKALADLTPPVRVPGMSDEEFEKLKKEYEEFIYKRSEIEYRLEREKNERIKKIRESDLSERLAKIDEAITKQNEDEFAKFANNEREKLKVAEKILRERIAQYRAAGKSTFELEAELERNRIAQVQTNLTTELLLAGQNVKKKYEARKAALEAELALVQGNADEEIRIQAELAENERDLLDARIDAFEQYASAVGSMASALNDLFSAIEERQLQKVKEKYEGQHAALEDSLARGIISQEQYDARSLALEKKQAKEEAKIKRQAAIRERIMALFNVAMNTAMGIMNAVSTFWMTGGMPWTAIIAALGAVQSAAILAAPLPTAAQGKYITGPSHAGGGKLIEAEGGEVIINKRSTSMFLPLLSAINEMGGGVPFVDFASDGGYALRAAAESGAGMSRGDMEHAIESAFGRVKIITTVEDIRRGEDQYANIESRGTI